MSDRKPVEHGVFEDIEDANRYDKESRYRNYSALRNFTTAAQQAKDPIWIPMHTSCTSPIS